MSFYKVEDFSMPELTILMPVYNTKVEWLSEAIESVLNQSYKDFEFLIIDDGSSSKDVWPCLLKYASLDQRIRLVRNNLNIGLVASLNKGLELSNSVWVGRMDADDVCKTDRFEKQMSYLCRYPETVVLGTNGRYIETGRPYSRKKIPVSLDQIRATLPFTCCFIHSAIVFNREKILELGGYPDLERAEDYALWLKILFETDYAMANLPEFLMYIRKGDSAKLAYRRKVSTSGKNIRDQIVTYLKLKNFPAIWGDAEGCITKKMVSAQQIKEAIAKRFPSVCKAMLEKESAKDQIKVLKNHKGFNALILLCLIKLKLLILWNELKIFASTREE